MCKCDNFKMGFKGSKWVWTGCSWLKIGSVASCPRHINEPSCLIKGGEFLYQLNDYQFLKKDSVI
jgi:hypothetical protein